MAISLLALCPHAFAVSGEAHCRNNDSEYHVHAATLKVVSINLAHGRGKALNQLLVSRGRTQRNLDEIAGTIQVLGANVVALQEADANSKWSGNFDHLGYLANASDYPCTFHGHHSRDAMATFGTALMARTRLLDARSVAFDPTPPAKQKGYVVARIRWHTGNRELVVTVVSAHLDFLSKTTRDSQIEAMIADLQTVGTPLIVMGDLNSDWNERRSQVKLLADRLALSAFKPEDEGLGTYKKRSGKRLDWILVSPELTFREHRVVEDVLSDHFALYAELEPVKAASP